MTVWFTADLHLGHGNIIRYCKRPFLSEAELEKMEKYHSSNLNRRFVTVGEIAENIGWKK